MSDSKLKQRLAAILAADVAGYSRLMAVDEHATVASLDAARSAFKSQIESNQGRVIDMAGDSVLAVFETATGAVSAALAVQRDLNASASTVPEECRMRFRIGVHLGDVIEKGDGTIYGDGVNIAARLQGLAEPGGITISDVVQTVVRGKLTASFVDQGEQRVKNIPHPVRAFAVRAEVTANRPSPASIAVDLSLPEMPSIAVLPFQNLSGDPEQEYFADGVVEDIITALSRMRWLFVIARNSSFTYKGRAVDVKQVGRELGVRYIVEGGVRKAANRVRITAQLIDASTAAHLWADRFEGGIEDIFDLQDRITESVVGAVAPSLERAEIERAKRKPTENLDSYDFFLRGMSSLHQRTAEATSEALRLFYRAIEYDADFASAFAMAAWCYVWRKINGWMSDRAQEIAEGMRLARRAVDLGSDDAVALARSGHAIGWLVGDLDSGNTLVDRALVLNPNLAAAWLLGAFLRAFRGEPEVAIERLSHAMRLSPRDPEMFRMQAGMALSHFLAGRYDEASLWAKKALLEQPNFLVPLGIAAASSALGGGLEEARRAMQRLRQFDSTLRVSNLKDWVPIHRPEDFAKWSEGLRKAGLPE